MKRENQSITYPIIKEFKPILWKECRFCHKEFRKETGYKIEELPAIRLLGNIQNNIFTYCCNDCFSNVDELKEEVIRLRDWLPEDESVKINHKGELL